LHAASIGGENATVRVFPFYGLGTVASISFIKMKKSSQITCASAEVMTRGWEVLELVWIPGNEGNWSRMNVAVARFNFSSARMAVRKRSGNKDMEGQLLLMSAPI
jgi:hypothetical protein